VDEKPGSLEAVTEGPRIQTFLIADVRGYTLFTQLRGDDAAAKLAAKFARIARETVQQRGGNVIELRGDEALAVFSSARQAVAAAVDLQERLVDETIDDPDLPLPVGIGLDAGEAVPLEGGYRGGALNLAARLCGHARPGEILASKGVTHLARRVEGVRYLDRGRVHLKNLTEPVELVRIVPEGADPVERLRTALPPSPPATRRPGPRVVVAAVVAFAVAAAATIVLLSRGSEPTIAAGAVAFVNPSGDLKGTVDVRGRPRGLAVGASSLWVVDQEGQRLLQVDPTTFRMEDRIPVGAGPSGVAFADGLVWVTNTDERSVSVVDPQAHEVVQSIIVGNGPAGIVADGDRVWVANSVDATVSEIDATTGRVIGEYPVGERPVALAVGAGAVWVANASDGTVSRVVSGTGETQAISVGRGPAAIAYAFGSLWVANAEDGTVMVIDPRTGSVTGTVRVGKDPVALASADDGVWAASARAGEIARIDPATRDVTETRDVENEPRALIGTKGGLWVGVEASPAVHRGGTLRLVTAQRVSIDPHGRDLLAYTVLAPIYDRLVTYRQAGGAAGMTVVPDLAVSVPVPTDEGHTYTFTLRDRIRFSNGHLLAPEDVVATFERVLVNGYGRHFLPELVGSSTCTGADPKACDLSKGIVADDPARTVTFHLVRPAPDFLRIIAMPSFAILPAGTPIDLEGEPIPATGPYMIEEIGTDGSLVLERNPVFKEWSADAQPDGFADRIEVTTGVAPSEQMGMVERGEADVALDGVPADLVQELGRRAPDQLVRSPFPAIGALALNTATYPFDHEDARRGVAFALDRAALAGAWAHTAQLVAGSLLVGEETHVTCQILPPNTPGYSPYCPYTRSGTTTAGSWAGQDFSRARELVKRSGTAGAEVVLAMSPCLEPTADQVASTLRDLGYRVTVKTDGPLRPPAIDCWFGSLSPVADVSFTAWAWDYPSPSQFLVPLLSCVQPDGTPAVEGAGYFSFNASNFCDHEIDRRMQRALDLQLTDPHASARAYEVLDHDLVDLAPMIPFGTGIDDWLVSKRASNFQVSPEFFGPLISQVWLR
jgi:peptide/nickel transport system substrate-binding protein